MGKGRGVNSFEALSCLLPAQTQESYSNLSYDSRSVGGDMKPRPQEHEAGIHPSRQQCSVTCPIAQ
jgi:hypothetical protein